jgi:hypothetical protein
MGLHGLLQECLYLYLYINIIDSFANLHMIPLMMEVEMVPEILETNFIFAWLIAVKNTSFRIVTVKASQSV